MLEKEPMTQHPNAVKGIVFKKTLGHYFVNADGQMVDCSHAYLSTFSFQARDFYEQLGYRVVGQIDDYPPGDTYYWLRKNFVPINEEQPRNERSQ